MRNIISAFCFLLSIPSFACLNGATKTLTNGLTLYEDYEGIVPHGHRFYEVDFHNLKKELDSLYKTTNNVDYLSDIGYVLVIEGKYAEALDLYLSLENSHPDRYATASNLGTIYELLGDNVNALKWIKRAMILNPHSHEGSEWLHVKILEAKLDPAKLSSTFFIGTEFGNFDMPISDLSQNRTYKLIDDIYYQLNERMTFIKSDDPIIAVLLFELGNLAMLQDNFRDASEIYKMASEYGYDDLVLTKRLSFLNGYFTPRNDTHTTERLVTRVNYEKTVLLILSIVASLGLFYLIFKKKSANAN